MKRKPDPILSPATLASVKRGLAQSAAGKVVYLGSFSKGAPQRTKRTRKP